QKLSFACFVRAFVDELRAQPSPLGYQLIADIRNEDALVEINPRMITVVLRHLFSNAGQAVMRHEKQVVRVRVVADELDVRCEIHDSGPGLPMRDWTVVLDPFYSTKGPFAHESGQAALDALGLGLTVSHHLLALHGGRLELRS